MFKQDNVVSTKPELVEEPATNDSSRAAVRLLEIATRNAEEIVDEAKAQAAATQAKAQAEADQLLAAAREKADKVYAELEKKQTEQNAEIARLEELETSLREKMRSQLNKLLTQVEPNAAA